MDRVTEPELMDEEEQARAYSEADFAAPHDHFVELCAEACGPLSGFVLDLGCGPADVTVRLAKKNPGALFHGVDGSEAMLRYGRERIAKANLGDRVTLTRAFLPQGAPPRSDYDFVVSNSLLHHLHDASALWTTVKRFAKKGARVFVMDLMRPSSPAAVDQLVAQYAAGEPDILQRDFHASLCAAFTAEEIAEQLARHELALRVDVVSDRHLTIRGNL
jgi:ubiquinone/menaquinone biosynthesis C-methylase UbiE